MRPPAKLTVSQWADRYRQLSGELGVSGQWRTDTAEYQREMMDCFTDPAIHQITVMKAARVGATVACIDNPIGYYIDQDPGPMLVVQPAIEDAKEWSKDHFDTMVRDTPCLEGKIPQKKSKDANILYKKFPGGILYVIGSNSPAGFRRKTIQRVLFDDVDGYEPTAGAEGDQIRLGWNRTITYTYHHRKMAVISTPTVRDISRVEFEFRQSDQRHFKVPCPHCQHRQVLLFSADSQFGHLATGMLRFDTTNLSWVYYECENCKGKIEERSKRQMIRAGAWEKQRPDVTGHAGFHLSEMISPFSNWYELAKAFLDAKMSRERLRVFINQRLGETFIEEKSFEVDESSLLARVEKYELVPAGVLVMTAGVDVQADRLEVLLYGWGKNQEGWMIDRRIIVGSPERARTWEELDEYLAKKWPSEYGFDLGPFETHGLNSICIDSGYSTENVYHYVKRRQTRRYYATKGDSGFKKPFIIDLKYEKKHRTRLATIAVDAIKTRVYDRLALVREPDQPPPPGYLHFHDRCNQSFFDQLTSERRTIVQDRRTGFSKLVWMLKENKRNEVLDCTVMNFAALTLLKPDFEILQTKLDAYLEERKMHALSGADTPAAEQNTAPVKPTPKQTKRRRPGSSFLTDW